jgi:hypothetical protein
VGKKSQKGKKEKKALDGGQGKETRKNLWSKRCGYHL